MRRGLVGRLGERDRDRPLDFALIAIACIQYHLIALRPRAAVQVEVELIDLCRECAAARGAGVQPAGSAISDDASGTDRMDLMPSLLMRSARAFGH